MIVSFYFKLYIIFLVMFDSVSLFHKINQLTWYSDTLKVWAEDLRYSENKSLLEIGTATGILASFLDSRGLHVTAIDLSENMIAKARAVNPKGIIFQQGDILQLDFADNHFDYVIAASVINVISDRRKGLSEMVRVCKKGGKVSILVPEEGMTKEKLNILIQQYGLTGFSREALLAWDNYAKKMSRSSLEELFKSAGLKKISTTEYLNGMAIGVTGVK